MSFSHEPVMLAEILDLLAYLEAGGKVFLFDRTALEKLTAAQRALGRLAYLHGTTAGNRIGMVVPYCDLGLPAYQSAQGVEHFTLPYTAVPSVAGNDELILCYS